VTSSTTAGTPTERLTRRVKALFDHTIAVGETRHSAPLSADIRKMSALFTDERQSRPGGYMNDPALRRAYLAYFAPLNAVKTALLLARLSDEGALPLSSGMRVADLGAGPLSSTIGVWLATQGFARAVAVDRSERALEEGLSVLEALDTEAAARVSLVARPLDQAALASEGPFDLVLMANVLNEIGDPRRDLDKRLSLVERALGALADDGHLLVLEPATRVHSRALQAVRDILVGRGAQVAAPCLTTRPCPLLASAGSWCFSELPFSPPPPAARLADRAGLHLSPLKTSFLLVGAAPRGTGQARVVGGQMRAEGVERRYLCAEPGLVTARGRPRLSSALWSSPRGMLVDMPEPGLIERGEGGPREPGGTRGPRRGGRRR